MNKGSPSDLAGRLLESVQRLRPLPGLLVTPDGGDLRETLLLQLRAKILPELGPADFPVFFAVQGGANVGKSTVFNALAGKILSPSIVQASATKHPLMFVHEKWRSSLLGEESFAGFVPVELEDPKDLIQDGERTELIYLRFHEDASLADVALVDSPDFDSALLTNLQVARAIAALSDVTLFVTTAQKYRDRELVDRLRSLGELKASVLLVFNMVDEEIVFQTLLDDLEEVLPLKSLGIRAVRLPSSRSPHPAEELREPLRSHVLGEIESFDPASVKPVILRRTVARVREAVGELRSRYLPELRIKERLVEKLESDLEARVREYSEYFNLAFPEETTAIRKILGMTEIGPRLQLPTAVEGSSNVLKIVGMAIRRCNDTVRDFFMRLSRSSEGSLEDRPDALEEYAAARDEADFENVRREAETLRRGLEGFCRSAESGSPLAKEVVADFFTPEISEAYSERIRTELDAEHSAREEAGGHFVRHLDVWRKEHTVLVQMLFLLASAVKIGSGVFVARLMPPDGMLSLVNWFWFVCGFFLASYLVALGVSLGVRRRKRFKETRIECMRAVLQKVFAEPFRQTLDAKLSQEALDEIESLADELARSGE